MSLAPFVDTPAAIVTGAPAVLLAQVLKSPNVRTVVETLPPWARPYRAEIAATVEAIHRAAAASAAAFEREDAALTSATDTGLPSAPSADALACTVAAAAVLLDLSVRRVQEYAAAGLLGGRRVGRAWLLDEQTVRMLATRRRSA